MIEMYAGIHTTDKMKLEKQFNELKIGSKHLDYRFRKTSKASA